MGITNVRDLFIYHLGGMRNFQIAGSAMLCAIAHRIEDAELTDLMYAEERSRQENLVRINMCLQEFRASPLEHPVPGIEALRQRYQTFVGLDPAPAMLDLFVLDTALRYMSLAVATFKELIELAPFTGEGQCCGLLNTIVEDKQRRAYNLQQHCRRVAATRPATRGA